MNTKQQIIKKHLLAIEKILKKYNLYSSTEPTEYMLSSTQPFSIDRLKPEEWLQFVFLPKMFALLEMNVDIQHFNVSAYIEESLHKEQNVELLVQELIALESIL